LFTPRPETRQKAVEEIPVPLRLDAGELLRHEVLHLDGVAEIGLFRFESDGSLQWLGVQREWERASVRLAVATTRWQGRAWFLCPACGRRSGRVFDPDGSGAWRCRDCASLTYISRRQSRRSHRTLGRDPKRQLELAIRMERGVRVRPWEAAAMEWLARRAVRQRRLLR